MQRQKKGDKVIIKRGGKKRLETGDSGSSPSYSTDVLYVFLSVKREYSAR